MNTQFFYNKKSYLVGLVSLVIGIIMVAVPYNELLNMIFTLIGLIIIALNVFPAIIYWLSYQQDKRILPLAISSTLSIVVGFIFIFWHHWFICLVLALWLIAFPIARIITSEDKVMRLKKELPLFVIAALLFFMPAEGILNVVFKVFGVLLIAYAIYEFVYTFLYNKKHENDDFNNDNHNDFNFDDLSSSSKKRNEDNVIDAEFKDIE